MRPAGRHLLYNWDEVLETLYRKSHMEQRAFTNEIFSYGSISLATQKNILELPEEKRIR